VVTVKRWEVLHILRKLEEDICTHSGSYFYCVNQAVEQYPAMIKFADMDSITKANTLLLVEEYEI